MVNLLKQGALNPNRIAEALSLDYKTVQHHIKVMKENNFITPEAEGYGAEYRLTEYFSANIVVFDEIWAKLAAGEKVFRPR